MMVALPQLMLRPEQDATPDVRVLRPKFFWLRLRWMGVHTESATLPAVRAGRDHAGQTPGYVLLPCTIRLVLLRWCLSRLFRT